MNKTTINKTYLPVFVSLDYSTCRQYFFLHFITSFFIHTHAPVIFLVTK